MIYSYDVGYVWMFIFILMYKNIIISVSIINFSFYGIIVFEF